MVVMKKLVTTTILVLAASVLAAAQERPASPAGTASAVVGGEWVKNADGNSVYQGGKWIEVTYSRPILRQRTNIFGAGADYGVAVRAGTPLWRAGANTTTVFKTEAPLMFGATKLPAGEYGLLVELKSPTEWTLVLSSQKRQPQFDANNKTDLIGAVNHDPKFDVLRAPMRVDSRAPQKLDQMSIYFLNVTKTGGQLAIAWENTVATIDFKVG
jgi:hypothetical protein